MLLRFIVEVYSKYLKLEKNTSIEFCIVTSKKVVLVV